MKNTFLYLPDESWCWLSNIIW